MRSSKLRVKPSDDCVPERKIASRSSARCLSRFLLFNNVNPIHAWYSPECLVLPQALFGKFDESNAMWFPHGSQAYKDSVWSEEVFGRENTSVQVMVVAAGTAGTAGVLDATVLADIARTYRPPCHPPYHPPCHRPCHPPYHTPVCNVYPDPLSRCS